MNNKGDDIVSSGSEILSILFLIGNLDLDPLNPSILSAWDKDSPSVKFITLYCFVFLWLFLFDDEGSNACFCAYGGIVA